MHVPETGNQVFARAVQNSRAGSRLDALAPPDLGNPVARNSDRSVSRLLTRRGIDYRDVSDVDWPLL
jgi:hypothetical protein